MLHPELLHRHAAMRIREDRERARRRQLRPRDPRPPGRVRRTVAAALVRVAARLDEEPAPAVTRRA